MTDQVLKPTQDIDWKSLPLYDDVEVKKLLASLPNSIWKAGRVRDDAQQRLDTVRHDLKVALAKAHLKARHDETLTSSDDRKAWAVVQPDVVQLEIDVIQAEGELAAARLNYERLDRWFTAVRKIASMLIDLEKAVDNTTRYGRGEETK